MPATQTTIDLLRRVLRETVSCPCCPIGSLMLMRDSREALVGCPTCGALWSPQRWAALNVR